MIRWASMAAAVIVSAAVTILAGGFPAAAQSVSFDKINNAHPPVSTARIIKRHPHDPEAFTQGLTVSGNVLYESTGQYGKSTVRRVDLDTGKILKKRDLPPKLFGEGLALLDDRIYQLTWRSGRGFAYDKTGLHPAGEFSYEGEGWGLTSDGSWLIMSDGTSELRFMNPFGFREMSRIRVRAGNLPISQLNELEYVDGEIWANVWKTDRIVRIDPSTGRVTGWIDCRAVVRDARRYSGAGVANGIAYDPETRRLFITGKNWSRMYEIRIEE